MSERLLDRISLKELVNNHIEPKRNELLDCSDQIRRNANEAFRSTSPTFERTVDLPWDRLGWYLFQQKSWKNEKHPIRRPIQGWLPSSEERQRLKTVYRQLEALMNLIDTRSYHYLQDTRTVERYVNLVPIWLSDFSGANVAA